MEIGLGKQFNTNRYSGVGGASKEESEKLAIKKAAQDFEAVFLGILTKSMRESVQKSDLMGDGNAEGMYQSMLDTEYTKQMANQNFTGLAKSIEEQLLRTRASGLSEIRQAVISADQVKTKGIQAYGLGR
ncbi:MAG: rod-binding protein [Pseudomonadota bacterium]